MYQPGMYQNNQSFGQTNTGRFQQTGFGPTPVQRSATAGIQAGSQGYGMTSSFAGGFQGQQGQEVHPVYRAQNQRAQEGPVIQQLGYQAGAQQGYAPTSGSFAGGSMMGGSAMGSTAMGGSFGGGFQAQQGQQGQEVHPVYRAQNQRAQEGPVIQQLGYQAGVQGGYNRGIANQGFANQGIANQGFANQASGISFTAPGASGASYSSPSFGQNQFQQPSFQGGAVTPENPVYRLTNQAQQEGPVLSRVGYTTDGVGTGAQFGGSSGYQRF